MIRSYRALVRDEWTTFAFGISCAFLSSPGQTFFISLFVGAVAADLGLGSAQLGSLYLGATLGAAGLLPLTGHWIDRIDLRLYFVLVAGGLSVACIVMAGATGPLGLFFAFVLLRLTGQGLMTHVAITSVARYLTEQRGRGLSLVSMGFPLSEAVMPAVAVNMMVIVGWRFTYVAVAVAVAMVATPVLLRMIWRAPAFTCPLAWKDSGGASTAREGFRIVARTRFFWLALPVLVYMPFSSTALIFHLHALVVAKGWSEDLVAPGFGCYAIGHAAGLLLAGGLIDRLGGRHLLALLSLPVLTGVALLGLLEVEATLVLFLGLMGLSSGFVQPAVAAAWAEVYGIARLGAVRSFALMVMVAGTSLGPAALGLAVDAGVPIGVICLALIGAGAVASLMAWLASRRSAGAR